MSYMSALGMSGPVFIGIVVVLLAIELIKAGSYLWNFVTPFVFKGKQKFVDRRTLDIMTKRHDVDIKDLKDSQNEIHESVKQLIETQQDFTATQQEIYATHQLFIERQDGINQKMGKEMDAIKEQLTDIADTVVSSQIQQMRSIILEFASICTSKRFSKERFSYVIKTHEEYEEVIKKRKMKNSEADASYNIIFNEYQRCIKDHDFLEDHNGEEERKPVKKTTKKTSTKKTATPKTEES